MTEEKRHKYLNDFRNNYGVNLEIELKGAENKTHVFLNRVEMLVEEEIKQRCPTFREELLKEKQREAIYKATLEQGYYLLSNYDMNIISGYDPVNNSVVNVDEIRKRAFSPLAAKILTNAGLFYAGIGQQSINRWGESNNV